MANQNRSTHSLISGVCLATVALMAAGSASAQEITLSFAHIFQPGHSTFVGAEEFAQRVEEETDGRVVVNVTPSGALGGMDSNLEALALGSVQITVAGESYTSQYYGPMGVTAAPYAFRSLDHYYDYVTSDLYSELSQGFTDATGHQIVGTFTQGFRNVTSNNPVREPSDMEGLRIRVPDAPLFTAMPIAVGASPTPVAFSEVYLSLQQGVVAAQENPIDTIHSLNLQEVQSHINLTQHMMEPAHIIVAGLAWDQLGEDDRATIMQIGADIGGSITENSNQRNQNLLAELEEGGMTIVRDVDIDAFAATVEEFNLSPDRNWSAELFNRLQALAE